MRTGSMASTGSLLSTKVQWKCRNVINSLESLVAARTKFRIAYSFSNPLQKMVWLDCEAERHCFPFICFTVLLLSKSQEQADIFLKNMGVRSCWLNEFSREKLMDVLNLRLKTLVALKKLITSRSLHSHDSFCVQYLTLHYVLEVVRWVRVDNYFAEYQNQVSLISYCRLYLYYY